LHEILEQLPAGARVLDLGCRSGSFSAAAYPFLTVRVDISRKASPGIYVQADAANLPFPARSFDAVILNHSLEHLSRLKPALQEVGRVVKADGAAFVSVPDATTLSDRIYRKVFRDAGGHLNLFDSSAELEKMLSWYLGLNHVATRPLCTSLSFLNRNNTRDPVVRRQARFRGFWEPVVALLMAASRWTDRRFSTRTSMYGWAFYFGNVTQRVDPRPLLNVCVRCGQAHEARDLVRNGSVKSALVVRIYPCPDCGARNVFAPDSPVPAGAVDTREVHNT
jgi:methyltransferase family protein